MNRPIYTYSYVVQGQNVSLETFLTLNSKCTQIETLVSRTSANHSNRLSSSIHFRRGTTLSILFAWILLLTGIPQSACASTESMVALLNRLAKKSNPIRKIYQSKERVQYFQNRLQRAKTDEERLSFSSQLAMELLNAGDTEASLKQFQDWEVFAQDVNPQLYRSNHHLLKQLQALCHLRLGEQENCLHNHTSASCLLPIRKEGVHQYPEGSEAAIVALESLLEQYPNDLSWSFGQIVVVLIIG